MMYEDEDIVGGSSSNCGVAASSATTSAAAPLFNSSTLPLARTSMKRPHSLTAQSGSSIMDHFKSVRSIRPRSKTIDSAFNHSKADSSDSDGEFIDEILPNKRNGAKSHHDCGFTTTGTTKTTSDDSESSDDSSSPTSKFGTLLAAFSSAKRTSTITAKSAFASLAQPSIARPLSSRPEVSPTTTTTSKSSNQLALVAKSSIPFPVSQPGSSKGQSTIAAGLQLSVLSELDEDCFGLTGVAQHHSGATHIPTDAEKQQFQRSLDSATALVFHRRNGIPLTSSPAPIRKCGTSFDFDSSLTSVNAIKKALFEKDSGPRHFIRSRPRSRLSFSSNPTSNVLLGNFEESVLNGRLEPASIVNGFTAEIGASGSFVPPHRTLPVTVFFYALFDTDKGDKMSGSPYLGHIALGPKGYHVPRTGTVQVTLFNPNGTVVKMFVVRYDLSDMPPNSRTFLRQRTLFMPSDATENHPDSRKWLRYLIHLRFQSSKSGRIRLHTDMRILVFQKHDLDVATLNGGGQMELRSFVQMPSNPKYSKNLKQS